MSHFEGHFEGAKTFLTPGDNGRASTFYQGVPWFDSRTMQFNIWHLERSTEKYWDVMYD
jgi:hypothetical protein